MNPLFYILVFGLGIFALAKTGDLAKTAITAGQLSVRILSVDKLKSIAGGLELSFSIAIDNPSNRTLSLKKPYIRILMNGNEIANSSPSGIITTIKANDRTTIKGISIGVPYSNIPSVFIALTANKKTNAVITIEIKLEADGIKATDSRNYKLDDLIGMFNT
ncbi:MAG TPA: hypothetical protein VN026_10765 [Bacteroidia bacterium]|jgi:hypothetical protein|nr:hypothetical protein [Bacteroidia bacterium]